MAIQVMIVDDHTVVREGLRKLLEDEGDIQVVGEAANGFEALQAVSAGCPDVLIMDVMMPVLNGIEATHQIRAVCPSSAVVILSMYADDERVVRAVQAGAAAYVLKDSSAKELVQAIHSVQAGKPFYSKRVAQVVRSYKAGGSPIYRLQRLNERERHILQLIAEGQTSAQMSAIFKLSPKTIETYRSRLMRKLDIDTIPGLVKFAIKHGLCSLDDVK